MRAAGRRRAGGRAIDEVICRRTARGWHVKFRGEGVRAVVDLSADDRQEDIRAEVRVPERPVSHLTGDVEMLRVLRAANGLEPLPFE